MIYETPKDRLRKFYNYESGVKKLKTLTKFYQKRSIPQPNYNSLRLDNFFKKIIGRRKQSAAIGRTRWGSKVRGITTNTKHRRSSSQAAPADTNAQTVPKEVLTKSFYDKVNSSVNHTYNTSRGKLIAYSKPVLGHNDSTRQNETLRLSQAFGISTENSGIDLPSFSELLQNESLITTKNHYETKKK